MSLFSERAPRVYALPPGADFATAFARGLNARMDGTPPEAIARVEVMVNTRRGLRAIEEALHAAAAGTALLPRLSLIAELGDDPLACPDIPPSIDPLRRQLRLIRLVERYLAASGRAPVTAAPDLAEALAALLDTLQEEGIDPTALDRLTAGELPETAAAHWRETLSFLDIVRHAWPAIRAELEGGAPDPKQRQRQVIGRLIRDWRDAPPPHPVIAAGSTGSVASTAELMAAIARLPQGAVVLPGFDSGIDPEAWAAAGPEHPMAPFRRFLSIVGLAPAEIRPWDDGPDPGPRHRLLSLALRPAPVTDAWQQAAPALAAEAGAATAGLTLIEAATPRHEAAAIALAIRRGLETPGIRIAVVTPDAALARRVGAELARFGVEPDDSLGRPLGGSPPGIFLRLIADVAVNGAEPVRLAALLQHPMMRPGLPRADHLALARRYETEVLRAKPEPGVLPGRLPRWPGADEQARHWLAGIEAEVARLAAAIHDRAPLAAVTAAHIAAAEVLSREPDGAASVWGGRDGRAVEDLLSRLAHNADAHGTDPGDGPGAAYPALLATLFDRESLPPEPGRPHPRVMIWGTQEARIQSADLVILAGLNEGVWPSLPGPDPWLSRPMRAALGLPSTDLGIGLAAHDFLQGAARETVILSRSRKVDGTPTVPSRWLTRLVNLLGGVGDGAALESMRARGEALLSLVPMIHRPGCTVARATRPAPRPPVEARPSRLSVTQVEMLIRDAYAIYARKVLGLQPLDPLGRPANYLVRGEVLHAVLQRFTERTGSGLPEPDAARRILLAVADEVLGENVPWPDMRRAWRARIGRFADWFLAREAVRRAEGRPGALEVKGALPVRLPAGRAITLSAKADRIDILEDGGAAIYDYKTGQPPSKRQIALGFNQQLHLQAHILKAGGFETLGAIEARIGAYLGLTGTGEGGTERRVEDLAAELEDHWQRFLRLMDTYMRPETPYLSHGRPEKTGTAGDYDHLARRGEWDGGDSDDSEGDVA